MADSDNQSGLSVGAVLVAFLSGAAIGALAALLFAPRSGKESREQLRDYARRAEDQLRELAGKATETWSTAVEKGRQFFEEQKAVVTEAIEAGREAMRRERERRASEQNT